MTKITIDPAVSDQLKATGANVQFVDEVGNVVGTYHREVSPPYDPDLIPTISDGELTQREEATGAMSTEAMLEFLRSGPSETALDYAEDSLNRRRSC